MTHAALPNRFIKIFHHNDLDHLVSGIFWLLLTVIQALLTLHVSVNHLDHTGGIIMLMSVMFIG